jgi:hypothetical protein
MKPHAIAIESANPFITAATRSGMVPYQFPDGESVTGLVERLRAVGWRGQVVGPHGSGKSTLLAALLPEVSRILGEVVVARLHQDSRQLPDQVEHTLGRSTPAIAPRLIILDGFEQLSFWRRRQLRRQCQARGIGLLVSTHRRLMGLPIIYRTQTTPDLAWQVICHLLRGSECPFTPKDIASRLAAHGGNMRELLFELYDWYEATLTA